MEIVSGTTRRTRNGSGSSGKRKADCDAGTYKLSPRKHNQNGKEDCCANDNTNCKVNNANCRGGSCKVVTSGELKRHKMTPLSSEGSTSTTSSSGSTLHSCSLNSPGVTVKSLHVDQQQRHIIVQRVSKIVTRGEATVTYNIKSEKAPEVIKTLQLKSSWSQLDWLSPGTLVNIVGVKPNASGSFTVDRTNGYLIVEPDRLISVTSVISQLYCERKAALSRFYMGGDSAVTFRGVVAHELICHAMSNGIKEDSELTKSVYKICQRPQMLERAYGVGMDDEELGKIQADVVQWVGRFMKKRFLTDAKVDKKYQNFKFKEVLGVEDNIWIPAYGMKGKIDATVLIEDDSGQKIVPLEFKTGSVKSQKRQSIKMDHVGQVTLYTLMMSMKFGSIDEALLYYISDDSLSRHQSKLFEMQHLMMMRNNYVRNTLLACGKFPNLPKPDGIDFDFKCKSCEIRNVCTLHVNRKSEVRETLCNTEKKLVDVCHLSEEELKFFEDWLFVINSETEVVEKKFNDKAIWTRTPAERVAGGTCITDLKINGKSSVPWKDGNGRPSFMITLKQDRNAPEHTFHVDEFVALSTNVEVNINYGVIVLIRGDEITLSLDQPLHKDYFIGNFVFTVDKINTSSPIACQFGYLAKLMDDNDDAARLREFIIKKKQPKYDKMTLPPVEVQKIIKDLNQEQKRVVMKSLLTDSFLFVKGTPGSGKTATIVALLRALVQSKKTVLVVSYTGTALENILVRYKIHGEDFVKVSTSGRSDSKFSGLTTKEISKTVSRIDQLREAYNKPIVATTLLSLKHPIFQVRRFDYCVVDEASQALPTAVFGALSFCDKYIVFGDPHQLPPIMSTSVLKTGNMSDNFFTLMATPTSTIKMNTQYRMNSCINQLANGLVYEDQMRCGQNDQAKAYIQLPEVRIRDFLKAHVNYSSSRRVFCHMISKKREKAVVFLDTSEVSAFESRSEESLINEVEKNLAISCSRLMVESGLHPAMVGIIAPYRGQVKLLRSALDKMPDNRYPQIEVNTVDQYQGREMEVIICSFTKSLPKDSNFFKSEDDREAKETDRESILEDIRRLNVAITRARVKLVMIGNRNTLQKFSPFRKLFGVLKEEQLHQLTEEELKGMCEPAIAHLLENCENIPSQDKKVPSEPIE